MKDLIDRAKNKGLSKGEALQRRGTLKNIKEGFNSLNLLYNKTPTIYSKIRAFVIITYRRFIRKLNKNLSIKIAVKDEHFDKELKYLGADGVHKNFKKH